MSITVTNKLMLGGIPLKVKQLSNSATNEYSWKSTVVSAIEIILVENMPTLDYDNKYYFYWYGIPYTLKKTSDSKLYFCAYIENNDVSGPSEADPKNEVRFNGISLSTKDSTTTGQSNSLIFYNSGYTIDDIEENGVSMVGGMPLSIGRIGSNWYLIVCSLTNFDSSKNSFDNGQNVFGTNRILNVSSVSRKNTVIPVINI